MGVTLNTLKNNFAQEQGYEDWDDLWHDHINRLLDFELHMNEICIRAQKAALEKAAKRSEIINDESTDFMWIVDRTSITNTENLIR